MNTNEIMLAYQAIAELMEKMAESARAADWEQVVALESRCNVEMEILKQHADASGLPKAQRQQRIQIITKILADDREIRSIAQPWMTQLSALINSASAERKLSNVYGLNASY